jgi:hypothetical protein
LLKAEARSVSVEKAVALCTNEIGHLQYVAKLWRKTFS